jgi:hypothetical protein
MAKISFKIAGKKITLRTPNKKQEDSGDSSIVAAAKKAAKYLSKRALPAIIASSLVLILILAGIGTGIIFSNTASTAIKPFTISNSVSCEENPAEQRKELARLLAGGDNTFGFIVEGAISMYNFAENFFKVRQVEAGCENELDFEGFEGWTWPLNANPPMTSSVYGSRKHPITGKPDFHDGVDYPAPCGTLIVAANDGVVLQTGYANSAGYYIIIAHNLFTTGATLTRYYHLQADSTIVNQGESVLSGQPIGLMGTTGSSTGCHLHFEISVGILFGFANILNVDPHQFIQDRIILQREIRELLPE